LLQYAKFNFHQQTHLTIQIEIDGANHAYSEVTDDFLYQNKVSPHKDTHETYAIFQIFKLDRISHNLKRHIKNISFVQNQM
jgi:hypothetical protein